MLNKSISARRGNKNVASEDPHVDSLSNIPYFHEKLFIELAGVGMKSLNPSIEMPSVFRGGIAGRQSDVDSFVNIHRFSILFSNHYCAFKYQL